MDKSKSAIHSVTCIHESNYLPAANSIVNLAVA